MIYLLAALCLGPVLQDGKLSDERIRELVEQLGSDYEEDRQAAKVELEKVGEKGEPFFAEGLDHADYRVRKICLDLLNKMGSKSAYARAAKLFRSKDEEKTVQAAAFVYLRRCGAQAEDLMIECLDSAEEAVRLGALETLVEIKSTKCPEKAAALYDKEPNRALKDKAFELLKAMGDPARPHLLKLLESADATVRLGAVQGLRQVTKEAGELLEPMAKLIRKETHPPIITEAFEVLKLVGAKAEPQLLDGLKAASEQVRQLSIQKLRDLKSAKALDAIGEMFQAETSDPVRNDAFEFLKAAGAAAEPAFLKAMEGKTPELRLKAIDGLKEIRSEKAYDAIAKLFRAEKDKAVLDRCWEYLKQMRAKAEPEFLFALKMEDAKIRKESIRQLGYIQSAAAIPELMGLLVDLDAEVKSEARNALVLVGPKAIEAVQEAAKAGRIKKDEESAILALYYQAGVEKLLLGMLSDKGAIGYYPGLFEPIAKFGKDRALPVLLRIVLEEDYRPGPHEESPGMLHWDYVRAIALMAVGEFGDAEALKKIKAMPMDGRDAYWVSEWLIARHKLGDAAGADDFVKRTLAEFDKTLKAGVADSLPEAFRSMTIAARIQLRTGRRDEALETYARFAKAYEGLPEPGSIPADQYSTALYNMACILAGQGKKAEAVERLAKAVDAGFKDLGWIQVDKDLDPIRGEEGYKKLVADEAKFKTE